VLLIIIFKCYLVFLALRTPANSNLGQELLGHSEDAIGTIDLILTNHLAKRYVIVSCYSGMLYKYISVYCSQWLDF
jgi:hypothetical protein